MPKVIDARMAEHVIVGANAGWIHRDREGALTLVTHRGYVPLTGDEDCRPAMGAQKARKTLDQHLARGERPSPLLLEELALELRMSMRTLLWVLRRRDGADVPETPIGLTEHDYLGTFTVTGEMIVADRCYVAETKPMLALATPAMRGVWHAFIRHPPLEIDASIAMFAVHADHLDDHDQNGDELGTFAVDSGSALLADRRARTHARMFKDGSRAWEEGIVDDMALFAWTELGDGLYQARAFTREGVATMVRASLSGPQQALYRLPKRPPPRGYVRELEHTLDAGSEVRDYSPKLRFAVGDRLRHVTFGDGVVRQILQDGKISVDFRDGPRTLVHAR